LLIEANGLSQKQLSEEWHAVTGDSFIVDIRPVRSKHELFAYVTKYASKPMEPGALRDPERLCELILAVRGRRLCMTFGSWRGCVLEPKDGEKIAWVVIGTLADVIRRSASGEPVARAALSQIEHRDRSYRNSLRSPPTPELHQNETIA
jgi:hypothetical protein